ncbi:hypothetical protein LWI28_002082 [Acer negundo]|uniref:TRF2/HOY1 PH-like domain-containing protein n=1 Tax=Acer negundo TaxID=4023 RepID=A0AAD5J416_ACENE|nr:hypothetical protein LWI28_002082 [Acer negundo]
MVHEGCGNADFTWNEYGGGGGGGHAPPGGGAPPPDDDEGSIELYSCETGKFVDETLYGSWIEDMEPPNKNCNQSQNSASNDQEKLVDEKEKKKEPPLIGLKLTISPYFLNSLNSIFLSQETNNRNRINQHHKRDSHSHSHQRRLMMMSHPPPPPPPHHHQPRHDDFVSQPSSSAAVTEKMKASNFPTLSLKIGSWERVSIHEGDLVAKCYYAKKKLVWEFLERSLKRKIEIQWSDISAIRAIIEDNVPGILHIELRQPPTFFDEIDPQPRKHTNWRTTQDFTGGQALMCRRHFLRFPAGVLDKHYEKLLQYDSRLFLLSQQPFPSSKYRYFPQQNENMYNFADYSINFKPEMVSPFNIHAQQQLQAYHHQQIINNPSLLNLGSPNSVIELASMADHNSSMWAGNRRGFQVQGASSFAESVARDQVQGGMSNIAPTGTTNFVYQNNNYVDANMFLNELENNFLTDYSNQQQQQYCQENAASMDTYINLYQRGNYTSNIATNQHLTYEHNTVTTTTTTMHSVNQHSMDNTALIYPPHPSLSWVAQPISMAMPPQSMAHAVSVAAPPQNMAQAMSQHVSMAALPQHMEEEMAVNQPKRNSFDQMMIDDIGTMNDINVANNNWQV